MKTIFACVLTAMIAVAATATAASLITGSQIAANTIHNHNIHKNTISLNRLTPGVQKLIKRTSAQSGGAVGATGAQGPAGANGAIGTAGTNGAKGDTGAAGTNGTNGTNGAAGPTLSTGNWGVINRNSDGSPVAQFRSGPSGASGSLNVLVSSGDKLNYANEVDFNGQLLAEATGVKYRVYYGADSPQSQAAIAPDFELFQNNAGPFTGYTSLVYVSKAAVSGDAHTWKAIDAGENTTNGNTSGWFFTNSGLAASSGCNQATYCTLATALTKVPASSTILSFGLNKGHDNAFQGAVDYLELDRSTGSVKFDFEETGVVPTPVP